MMALALAFAATAAVGSGAGLDTYLWDPVALLATRAAIRGGGAGVATAESYAGLARSARIMVPSSDKAIPWQWDIGPWSVMNKTLATPANLSRHNYLSIGIYNHPCSALPPKCKPYPGACASSVEPSHLSPPLPGHPTALSEIMAHPQRLLLGH